MLAGGMPMLDYVKIRESTPTGNPVATDSPTYQAMLVLLRELVQPIFAKDGLGHEVTVELTLKITPAPRIGNPERTQRR
jgi:hypothetical protein